MHKPTVFVHGTTVDGSCWDKTIAALAGINGFDREKLHAISFENSVGEAHHRMSEQLDEYVNTILQDSAHDSVNVVGHSLGASGVRYWLAEYDRYDIVDTVVYMAGALHGTYACNLKPFVSENLAEPCTRISVDAMDDPDNILAQLNGGKNECPEGTTHYTIRALFDRYFLFNPTSPRLRGAERNLLVPTTHRGLLKCRYVHRTLAEWLS